MQRKPIAAVAAAAATRTSRLYITGGFTMFLVFVLLRYADPSAAGSRLGERSVRPPSA